MKKIDIKDENYYTTDAFTDKAIKFISEAITDNQERPFFLYLSYNAPHWPLQAPKSEIDKYRGKYMNGWKNLRQQRYNRMIEMELIDSTWNLSYDDIVSWESLD
jgi:arylsulfatase